MLDAGCGPVPYQRQDAALSERTCGAAALCMVYHSLGLTCTQAEVWPDIAREDRYGNRFARTYLLAADALRRGLAATTLQVRDPWQTLERLLSRDIRVILNHRLSRSLPAGHFTVLVHIEPAHLVVHDPQYGPERRLEREEFLSLWRPGWGTRDVAGHVLVAVSQPQLDPERCRHCSAAVAASVACPACGKTVPLSPSRALGCADANCRERTWQRVYCPHCDHALARIG